MRNYDGGLLYYVDEVLDAIRSNALPLQQKLAVLDIVRTILTFTEMPSRHVQAIALRDTTTSSEPPAA